MIGPVGTAGTPINRTECVGRGRSLAALAAATLLAAGSALALAPADASGAIASERIERSPAQVRDYWTPKRMREARPVLRLLEGVRELVDRARPPEAGTPSAVPPSRPGARAPGAGIVDGIVDGLLGGAEPAPRAAAAQVPRSGSYPSRTHGKVFFRVPGRGGFVCSGTVVRSAGRSLVLTAGHCVYDQVAGSFATDWMFVPGFDGGDRPYGSWVARRLATTSQFRSSGSLRYDVGVATVRRNRNGRGIQDRVGARGIAFNQPRNRLYRAYGYPARGGFDGRELYRCDAPFEGTDRGFRPPRPLRIDCDMTGGASGGGWVVGNRFVSSLTSYAYECTPSLLLPCSNPEAGKLFGPYFGDIARRLYRANRGRARRCGGSVVTHQGAKRHDRIRGTRRADVIHGGPGRDLLRGRGGADVICPGNGHDRVLAAAGRDVIRDPRGRNRIRCGPGRDLVITNRRSRVAGDCERVRRR